MKLEINCIIFVFVIQIWRCPDFNLIQCKQLPSSCVSFRMIYIRHGDLACPGCLICADPAPVVPWVAPPVVNELPAVTKINPKRKKKRKMKEKERKRRERKKMKVINQSINQSINQRSVSRSINQSINQSISQSSKQASKQAINKSINQSINQLINQSTSFISLIIQH